MLRKNSASRAVAQRIEGLDAGADDYLLKPYDLSLIHI